jgi:hypothetical protein
MYPARLISFVANKPRPVAERATRKEREDMVCGQRQFRWCHHPQAADDDKSSRENALRFAQSFL